MSDFIGTSYGVDADLGCTVDPRMAGRRQKAEKALRPIAASTSAERAARRGTWVCSGGRRLIVTYGVPGSRVVYRASHSEQRVRRLVRGVGTIGAGAQEEEPLLSVDTLRSKLVDFLVRPTSIIGSGPLFDRPWAPAACACHDQWRIPFDELLSEASGKRCVLRSEHNVSRVR